MKLFRMTFSYALFNSKTYVNNDRSKIISICPRYILALFMRSHSLISSFLPSKYDLGKRALRQQHKQSNDRI